MKNLKELLDKYYRGETSEAEELSLKEWFRNEKNESTEKDMFGYYENECKVPEELEESIFLSIQQKQNKTKRLNTRFIRFLSTAAAVLVVLSIYFNVQTRKKTELENQFLVMERALFQVSESIQPEETDEMLVLWVDNDIEIIIN